MDTLQQQMLLSQVHVWVRELERAVMAYEAVVEETERLMENVEQAENVVDGDGQDVQQLEHALGSAQQLAEMVRAADATLCDVMVTAGHVFGETPDASVVCEREQDAFDAEETVKRARVGAINRARTDGDRDGGVINHARTEGPLPNGAVILQGRYGIVQLIHQRPRVNLYLAQRLAGGTQTNSTNGGAHFIASGISDSGSTIPDEPLVAIRELVLTGLALQERKEIERATFEEFVSPAMLGTPHLPGAGDRIQVEDERHYLVMQLRRVRGGRHAIACTLSELLLSWRQWPLWLDVPVALDWTIQLGRIVARLHRLGVVLGDLNPATVLVDREGGAEWAPVLLISWPPAPHFWPTSAPESASEETVAARYARMFPIPGTVDSAFAAPEMLEGQCTERSDVYALGALLYLFLTRYAPAAPTLRQQALDGKRGNGAHADGMALIPLHLFNSRIPTVLEEIVLRALALEPEERYASVFELAEALEAVELAQRVQQNGFAPRQNGARRVSKMRQVVEWLKQELRT